MLIVFEGGEGSGKGSQIKLLKKFLRNKEYKVIDIVEPGGTPAGKAIRNILLHRKGLGLLGITEAFLFSAFRAQLVREVTLPALEQGKIVLSDRSYYSTYAYQGYGRQQDLGLMKQLTEIAIGDTKPDLVLLLDLPPEIGITRKIHQNEFNRLDNESIEFHLRVRSGYLKLAAENPQLWRVVDATAPIDEVHKQIVKLVLEVL